MLIRSAMAPLAQSRPRYMTIALFLSSLTGALSALNGYNGIQFYSGEHIDASAVTQALKDDVLKDDAVRARATAIIEEFIRTKDAARSRIFPLHIASFLLGITMVVLTLRTMGGRSGARTALVQVVTVRTAVRVAGYFLTADTRAIEIQLAQAIGNLNQNVARLIDPTSLVFDVLTSSFILVALTRPSARAWCELRSGEQP